MKSNFKRTSRFAVIVLLIAALCIIPAGCGGGEEEGLSTFRMGSSAEFDTLNPLSSYMQVTYEFFLLVYDPLVRYDENYDSIPCLAKSWELSEDELTWTFELEEGVLWHDGEPFTSEDVKFTYELMMDTGLGYMYSAYLEDITDITCPDDHTVVITTEFPKANMLMNTTPILPAHIFAEIPEEELEIFENDDPVGTGPYKFDSVGDNFVKIVKNPEYFGEKPHVDEFIFVNYENIDAMAQSLKLGEIDGATNLNPSQISQLEADANITVISGMELGFMQVGINCWSDSASGGNPLLLDKTIRQAIDQAIDKQKVVDMAYNGQGTAGLTLINPGDFFHYEPSGEEFRAYNPEAAAAKLESAGYVDSNGDGIRETRDGTPLEFSFITISDNIEEVKSGQMIAADCAAVGIKINNVTMDSGALYDKIVEGNYDMFIWGWGSDIDPTSILSILITDEIGGNNEPFFSNRRYDELYIQQQREMDENERQEMVFEMQRILYDEVPYSILVYSNNIQAIRSDRFTGFKQIPENGMYFFNMTALNYLNIRPL